MNTEILNEKEFILRLIKDDLTNIRLVSGLQALGFTSAGDYHLHLTQTIFLLMGFEAGSEGEERIFKDYCANSKKVLRINIFKHPQQFDEFANELYNILKEEVDISV